MALIPKVALACNNSSYHHKIKNDDRPHHGLSPFFLYPYDDSFKEGSPHEKQPKLFWNFFTNVLSSLLFSSPTIQVHFYTPFLEKIYNFLYTKYLQHINQLVAFFFGPFPYFRVLNNIVFTSLLPNYSHTTRPHQPYYYTLKTASSPFFCTKLALSTIYFKLSTTLSAPRLHGETKVFFVIFLYNFRTHVGNDKQK